MLFAEPMEIGALREKIDEQSEALPDATVQDVKIEGEKSGVRFVINTSNKKKSDVEEVLKKIFEGKLETNSFETIGPLAQITDLPGRKPVESPAGGATKTETPKPETPKSETAPATEAPAKEPATSEPAKTETPATTPSDAGKSPEPSADAPKSSASERFRPEDARLLALADAQDKTDSAPKTSPADTAPVDTKTDDKPATEPAATETPASDQPTKTTPASEKATPATLGKSPTSSLPAEATISTPSRLIGGTQAELKFNLRIGAEELLATLTRAIAATPSVDQNPVIEVDNIAQAEKKGLKKYENWTVRTSLPEKDLQVVLQQAKTQLANDPIFPESNQIGAKVADKTKDQAMMAMAASLLLILAYVWFRFSQVMFGVAAVVAVIHDVLVTLGAIALSYWLAEIPGFDFLLVEPFKISLPIIAAFLTIIGYSLNDTIVIFDRIREARGKSPMITPELANRCINETLSRTILTSLTVFIVVLILYIAGGQAIHGFAFALVVGVIAGSYSTIYIATPIVLWMNRHAGEEKKTRSTAELAKVSQRTRTA
jgi:SecD/SecF fusion protein